MNLERIARKLQSEGYTAEEADAATSRMAEDMLDDQRDREVEERLKEKE